MEPSVSTAVTKPSCYGIAAHANLTAADPSDRARDIGGKAKDNETENRKLYSVTASTEKPLTEALTVEGKHGERRVKA